MAIMIKDAENFEINLVKDKRTRLEQLEDLSYEICQGWKEGDLNEILEEIKEVIYDEKEVVFQEVIDKLSNNKWYLPWKELKEGVKRFLDGADDFIKNVNLKEIKVKNLIDMINDEKDSIKERQVILKVANKIRILLKLRI